MMTKKINLSDYPLYSKKQSLIRSLTGKSLDEISLNEIVRGKISDQDLRISPETLEFQAKIAELEGKKPLSENFRRAAELCRVPDQKVLEIYEALRPNRSGKEDLEKLAIELETNFRAFTNAALIRRAILAYEERGLLKKN